MRRHRVNTLMLAATCQAAFWSGILSQTLCSAVEADLAPLTLKRIRIFGQLWSQPELIEAHEEMMENSQWCLFFSGAY